MSCGRHGVNLCQAVSCVTLYYIILDILVWCTAWLSLQELIWRAHLSTSVLQGVSKVIPPTSMRSLRDSLTLRYTAALWLTSGKIMVTHAVTCAFFRLSLWLVLCAVKNWNEAMGYDSSFKVLSSVKVLYMSQYSPIHPRVAVTIQDDTCTSEAVKVTLWFFCSLNTVKELTKTPNQYPPV